MVPLGSSSTVRSVRGRRVVGRWCRVQRLLRRGSDLRTGSLAQYPPADVALLTAGHAEVTGTDVAGDGRPRGNERAGADHERCGEDGVAADETVVTDDGGGLGDPVVVGE